MWHSPSDGRKPLFSKPGMILTLLYLGYLLSFADRVIFGMVLKPIKEELGLSDSELGLLSGLALAFSYAVFSPLAGYFVDRVSRTRLMAAAISFWSAMTMATAFATSFAVMGLARLGVGAGEAFLHPLAVSLLSDTVPQERRSRAFAFYLSAGAVGSACALLFGGILIKRLLALGHVVLPVFGALAPWQGLFVAAGLLGILLAVGVLLIMRDPPRTASDAQRSAAANSSEPTALSFIRFHPGLSWAVFIGIALLQMASYTMSSWAVVFFERAFGWTNAQAALGIGSTGSIAAIVGCLAAARIITALKTRGYADAPLRVAVIGGIGFSGCVIPGLLAPSPQIALTFFIFGFFWAYIPSVAAFTALGEVFPVGTRARLAGVHTLAGGLISNSLGPYLVGVFSDHFFQSHDGIRYALISTLALAATCGAMSVFLGLRPYRRRVATIGPAMANA